MLLVVVSSMKNDDQNELKEEWEKYMSDFVPDD